ncbi:5'-nucleotidase /3'-nucleotidase /exopolyphosphatase [Desulfonauticus submarinus]|uniref:5'-nucleotidase SurE n=1 Tax=Desulfonauticus submarinus TaxID=206665 RepID=A0A1G9ZXT1_9BACT|nr:5'/3'-nucleotidase SurE [Desulfonauticus submarinus]SDN25904.1 5'-nucleotidase /3'-nucleotidase /exopolyphosphatase [Desulfonauticus submarinus]
MVILLTNDDGIQALGLRALYWALKEMGHRVEVVAPLTEQSAVGHAITIFSPLRVKVIKENGFKGIGISGTPVDCVKWALSFHFNQKPDLIISGINNGANVGIDVLYSGTVSAATEGALLEIPALAVSIDDFRPTNLTEEAKWVSDFISKICWENLNARTVLNLNFPNCGIRKARGIKVCPQTDVVYEDKYEKRKDPRGREYYWLFGDIPMSRVKTGTDRDLLSKGYVTLTPLKFELTDKELISNWSKWCKEVLT